jgi:hypothetical protein
MKKIIIIMSLSALNVYATDYKIGLNTSLYNDSITIEEHSGGTTPSISCTLPEVVNEAADGCIDSLDKVGWIFRDDSCSGIRQMTSNPNLYILRSNSATRNENPIIPEGYRWINTSEYVGSGSRPYNYYGQCGNSAYPTASGINQKEISFADSHTTNLRAHAGSSEASKGNVGWTFPTAWLGIVVVKEF